MRTYARALGVPAQQAEDMFSRMRGGRRTCNSPLQRKRRRFLPASSDLQQPSLRFFGMPLEKICPHARRDAQGHDDSSQMPPSMLPFLPSRDHAGFVPPCSRSGSLYVQTAPSTCECEWQLCPFFERIGYHPPSPKNAASKVLWNECGSGSIRHLNCDNVSGKPETAII
mgnify:FL=1